jgi:hypothetical protein
MNSAAAVSWQFLRGVLPYPDVRRRSRVRRRALRLVTCKEWPGDDARGMEAAQLALLRLLWLQRLTADAVGMRRGEDAALLARAALETCIVGLYCVHSGDAIAHLSAANHRAEGVVSYLSNGGLGSQAAIDSAVGALGELGPDLDIRDLALWLEREHGLVLAASLYRTYYVPLSHLFTHAYAFALLRHVRPDGTVHDRPAYPWARRSAARMTDGCTGLLAASIADKSGVPSELFHRYSTAHLDRLLTPALVFTVKGTLRSGPWRKIPEALKALVEAQSHVDVDAASRDSDPGWPDASTSDEAADFFEPLPPEAHDEVFTQPADDQLDEMNPSADEQRQARHRRPGKAAAHR